MNSNEWKLASDGVTFPRNRKSAIANTARQANLRHKRRKKRAAGFDEWEIILCEIALNHRFHRGSPLLTIPVEATAA